MPQSNGPLEPWERELLGENTEFVEHTLQQWSVEGNHTHAATMQTVDAAVGGDQSAVAELRHQINVDPAPLIEALGAATLSANAASERLRTITWPTYSAGGRITSNRFINNRFAGTIPDGEQLAEAVENAQTPSPRLPERERRTYPLQPAAAVMSQSRPAEYDEVEEYEDEPDPLTEYRWGEHPGPTVRRYDTEDMTVEQRDELIQFANQWSRMTRWGIDHGFINLNPADIHMGYFINSGNRLLHFDPVQPVSPDAEPAIDLF